MTDVKNYNWDEYEKQAMDFLEKTSSEISINYIKYDYHFEGDKHKRDIYKICLKRGRREYKFNFGQSLANSGFFMTYKAISPSSMHLLIDENYRDATVSTKKEYNSIHVKGTDLYITPTESGKSLFRLEVNEKWIATKKQPTEYSILSCLQNYELGSFNDFCYDFGYDADSITDFKTYENVKNEYVNLCNLYNDEELELLGNIQ